MAGLKDALLLINPSRNPGRLKHLRRAAARFGVGTAVVTRDRPHFIREVESFARGPKRFLLVWGGDGTAHEAINGLMRIKGEGDTREKSVGFLRGGTGNGIQDSYMVPYRISRQMAVFAQAIHRDYTLAVDLITVQSGSFQRWCQLAGVGLDAAVLARRERHETIGGQVRFPVAGFLSYASAAIGAIFSEEFRSHPYTVAMSEGKYAFSGPRVNAEFPFREIRLNRSSTLLEVGTRPFYGKLFRICPDVVCNDGSMDVYLFNFASRVSVARFLPSLWRGRHDRINAGSLRAAMPRIERFEVKGLRVESDRPFRYHLDGELLEARERGGGIYAIEGRVVPEAIRFLVPPAFHRLFTPPPGIAGPPGSLV
ncbi:MAG: diacylglycerol/lipid kinase family protein [Alkalispirochaetaceae bacterium]